MNQQQRTPRVRDNDANKKPPRAVGVRERWWLCLVMVAAVSTPLFAQDKGSVNMTGSAPAELKPFDDLMTATLRDGEVPGAALVVVKDGRLVLARGYGWADKKERRAVRPESLFRIASLSKQLTAVAILQLVERRQLSLDSRVFDVLGLQRFAEDGREVDPRLRRVTVDQLLRHTGGFDRGKSFDPMFRSLEIAAEFGFRPPAAARDVIRYMATRPLDFDPGARYAYSNIGYCLLGRVIEKVSSLPYETYVVRRVLRPLGMRQTRLGKTLPPWRAENEVAYYTHEEDSPAVVGQVGRKAPRPYGAWYLEAMDAHGGWISSAVEMARFAAAFDDPEHCPVLRAASVRTMFSREGSARGFDKDDDRAYYACGWMVRPVGDNGAANHWHTGSLAGTAALMVRRHDGLNWVVLFNTRSKSDGQHLGRKLDHPLHRAADAVKHWPDGDLFPTFLENP